MWCVLSSCRSTDWGGTNPGTYEEVRRVSLSRLARYLETRSEGLITPDPRASAYPDSALTFTWDPYDRRRIPAPFYAYPESIQTLFHFDEERFVRESGHEDFLAASYAFYAERPFNPRKQEYLLPYRTPGSWGSLFFPPIRQLTRPLNLALFS